ncbi:MAG: PadR family transcriptional regulator [Steroidobacteraceae bacterium]
MTRINDKTIGATDSELRRGVLVLAVLSQLAEWQYGYSLRQAMVELGMPIEEGTLYPLLRRLESQGLLMSEWRIENGPPRRYYRLSAPGRQVYRTLAASWRELVSIMRRVLDEGV